MTGYGWAFDDLGMATSADAALMLDVGCHQDAADAAQLDARPQRPEALQDKFAIV